jgi:hypothetical protein
MQQHVHVKLRGKWSTSSKLMVTHVCIHISTMKCHHGDLTAVPSNPQMGKLVKNNRKPYRRMSFNIILSCMTFIMLLNICGGLQKNKVSYFPATNIHYQHLHFILQFVFCNLSKQEDHFPLNMSLFIFISILALGKEGRAWRSYIQASIYKYKYKYIYIYIYTVCLTRGWPWKMLVYKKYNTFACWFTFTCHTCLSSWTTLNR